MIHFLGTLTTLELALTALAVLVTLWIATTPLMLSRLRRRRTLRLADELYSELVGELDRLETQKRPTRVQIRPPVGLTTTEASSSAQPDPLKDLSRQQITKLRTRAEGVHRGLRFQNRAALEGSCRRLSEIARELRTLGEQIGNREAPQAATAPLQPPPQLGTLVLVESA